MIRDMIYGGRGTTDTKVSATLIFYSEELLFDIANNAYREGDITIVENPHDRHQIQDVVEEGNKERVGRVLDLAHGEVLELLYPFTKSDVEDGMVLDDVLRYKKQYVVTLTLPSDFSKTSVLHLKTLIHEYMVYSVLMDWMSLVKPDAQEKWTLKLADVTEQIEEVKNRRTGRTRIKLHPF